MNSHDQHANQATPQRMTPRHEHGTRALSYPEGCTVAHIKLADAHAARELALLARAPLVALVLGKLLAALARALLVEAQIARRGHQSGGDVRACGTRAKCHVTGTGATAWHWAALPYVVAMNVASATRQGGISSIQDDPATTLLRHWRRRWRRGGWRR
eukprot:7379851-Prymnesium_polylepis.5